MSQSTRDRQERILAQVLDRRHVTVKDLAEALSVSEATVRRDLKSLADERRLSLVHGGATLPRDIDFSFQAKQVRNVEAKQTIGRLAAELVSDGDQVFLDSGTTCFEAGRQLTGKRSLCLLVNSARLILELNAPGLSVISLGGQYRPDRMDTVGPIATATLDQLRGYLAFVGADGVSMDFGPSADDVDSAHLYGMAIEHAREAILLVDHTKFASPSLFRIVAWDRISRVVTDRRPEDDWMVFLDKQGIEVIHPNGSETDGETNESTRPAAAAASR